MKKYVLLFLLAVLATSFFSGCDMQEQGNEVAEEDDSSGSDLAIVIRISANEAMDMMTDDAIILDVRNPDEFAQGHIPNAILLPSSEVQRDAESILPDKNQVILVYCRSGVRSAAAAQELVALGYTAVYDFGGILDWHGEIVTEE